MYNQWLVLAYWENLQDIPMVSTYLQLSVLNHATAHTLNVPKHLKLYLKKINGNNFITYWRFFYPVFFCQFNEKEK